MEQYKDLASFFLPEGMLDWFEVTKAEVTELGNAKILHAYLDENEYMPDSRTDLKPNGFYSESCYLDFLVRGHKCILHVRRRR
jgi:hypothetical protein